MKNAAVAFFDPRTIARIAAVPRPAISFGDLDAERGEAAWHGHR